jgi:hypothetical protein
LIVKECVSAPGEAIVAYLCHRFREIEGKLGMVPGIVRPTTAANPHELATPLDAAGLAVMTIPCKKLRSLLCGSLTGFPVCLPVVVEPQRA